MNEQRVSEFAAGRALRVELAVLEKELSALWRQAGEGVAGKERAAVTRACLWNLVVHASDGATFDRAKAMIDAIASRVPARVLVLKADRTAPSTPIEAWIEANWQRVGGGASQIGSDEVTLCGGGESVDDLASVVRALLVPDVPTAALWLGATPDGTRPLDRELLGAADRVVVGGEREEDLRRLGRLWGEEPRRYAGDLIGLSWLCASAWRQLLASLFDPPTPAPEAFAALRAEIVCAPEHRGAALLYLGWLASRLRWSEGRARGDGRFVFLRAGGATVEATIELSPGAPLPFSSVALTTSEGTYSVARHGAAVVLNTPTIAFKQPVHLPDEAELWIAALGARGRDPLFVEALRQIATLD
ncbi:MAG: hypothetical protein EXR72_06105 [Myxococcales bacterium]|nr:hypothetical protein [Myxococcales bacterium]